MINLLWLPTKYAEENKFQTKSQKQALWIFRKTLYFHWIGPYLRKQTKKCISPFIVWTKTAKTWIMLIRNFPNLWFDGYSIRIHSLLDEILETVFWIGSCTRENVYDFPIKLQKMDKNYKQEFLGAYWVAWQRIQW